MIVVIQYQFLTYIVGGHLGFFRIGHIEVPQYFKFA